LDTHFCPFITPERERDIGIGRERVILKKLEGEEVLSEIEEERERWVRVVTYFLIGLKKNGRC